MEQQERPVIAVLNTSFEVTELLREVLIENGFDPVSAYTIEFKHGLMDLSSFFQKYHPQAMIYDIAIPYVENWKFFLDKILGSNVLPEQCFVLTTTNKSMLEVLVGPTPALELVGKPYDLDTIIQAVQRVIERNKTQSQNPNELSAEA